MKRVLLPVPNLAARVLALLRDPVACDLMEFGGVRVATAEKFLEENPTSDLPLCKHCRKKPVAKHGDIYCGKHCRAVGGWQVRLAVQRRKATAP